MLKLHRILFYLDNKKIMTVIVATNGTLIKVRCQQKEKIFKAALTEPDLQPRPPPYPNLF